MKVKRLSSTAREIFEKAKKFDTHLTTETGAWREAYSFWQDTNLSRLSEYDKKQLARYSMHLCFEQVRYKEGRPTEEMVNLSKKFGMTGFEFQRWMRRHDHWKNWTIRRINDWGTRGFYGICRISAQFNVWTRTGKNESDPVGLNYNYSDIWNQIETEFNSEDKLELKESINSEAKRHEGNIDYLTKETFPDSPYMMGFTSFRDNMGSHNMDGYLANIYSAKQRIKACKLVGLRARAKMIENKIACLGERYLAGIESWKLNPELKKEFIDEYRKYTQES